MMVCTGWSWVGSPPGVAPTAPSAPAPLGGADVPGWAGAGDWASGAETGVLVGAGLGALAGADGEGGGAVGAAVWAPAARQTRPSVRAANAVPARNRVPGRNLLRIISTFTRTILFNKGCSVFDASEEYPQLFRKRNINHYPLRRPRVQELEVCRVEEVPRQLQHGRTAADRSCNLVWCTVQKVSHHRMPKRLHMHSNLMRAAGLNGHLDHRERPVRRCQPVQHMYVGDCSAAVSPARGHARSADEVARDRQVHGHVVLCQTPVYQREITFRHPPFGEHLAQLAM